MLPLWLLVGVLTGTIVNLLAYRLPCRKPALSASACCGECGAPLGPAVLIPLAGFVLSKGKCRVCGAKLPVRLPLVELSTAALFATLFLRLGLSWLLVVSCLYAAILVLVFVIDLEHRLILNIVTYPSMALAIMLGFAVPGLNALSGLLGGLFYGGLFLALYVASVLIYKREDALGQGDVKLAIFIGLITGMPGALYAALAGTILGALAGLWAIIVNKASGKSTMPYGTSLSIGALAVLVWSPWIG